MLQLQLLKSLSIIIILSSCSSTYHLKKAIKKDPTIITEKVLIDTLKIVSIDSIPYIVNDTIRYKLIERVTDTLITFRYKHITAPITRQDKRLNERTERLLIKEQQKTARLISRLNKRNKAVETRLKKAVSRHENKGFGLELLTIGLIVGFFLRLILKKFLI